MRINLVFIYPAINLSNILKHNLFNYNQYILNEALNNSMSDNHHNENVQSNFPWINKEFFEKILQKEIDNFKSVLGYTLKSALKLGENYASEMIRANVNYAIKSCDSENKSETISFIIKAALLNQQLKNELDELNVFQKEIVIYRDILPAVQKLLQSIGDDSKFSAK